MAQIIIYSTLGLQEMLPPEHTKVSAVLEQVLDDDLEWLYEMAVKILLPPA